LASPPDCGIGFHQTSGAVFEFRISENKNILIFGGEDFRHFMYWENRMSVGPV